MPPVPEIRVKKVNDKKINPDGDFILYWMIGSRRLQWNYSLDRALEWAVKLNRPVIVLEALRCDYKWASERLHKFIMEGMACNYRDAEGKNILYYPYAEPAVNAGKGLLKALSEHACLTVTDDFPVFFLPSMVKRAADLVSTYLELVDSNGLLPLMEPDREFTTAYSFRRFLQKRLPAFLPDHPDKSPLDSPDIPAAGRIPGQIKKKWPPVPVESLKKCNELIKNLPVDHGVTGAGLMGGTKTARGLLNMFINEKLPGYSERRNQPEQDAQSGLSPYLHFGHISSHEIFHRVQENENWHIGKLSEKTDGKRSGWWGMSGSSEEFLDQLVTWREIGFNMCSRRPDCDRYESLPDWAKKTLKDHEMDEREYIYSPEEFENAGTHDPLWNAAQRQLKKEGIIHNYLRMLWGKKILEWSETPKKALKTMLHLNNRYALDGRDPNSLSGIFWTLGRYDRAWGPERKIFGKIRYMSSKNTARKVRVTDYIKKYS